MHKPAIITAKFVGQGLLLQVCDWNLQYHAHW